MRPLPFALFFASLLAPIVPSSRAQEPASGGVTLEQVREEIRRELGSVPRAKANANVFNPTMGVVLDAVAGQTHVERGSLKLRAAELNLQSEVDPYARLYAIIVGGDSGLSVEEAAAVTTSLPGNLTLRGGRFFANFGRLPKFHDHELPFVRRTASLDAFIGGESRMDGLELTHLFRTPFFLQGTLGVGSKMGGENERLKENGSASALGLAGHEGNRPWDAFTYNARLFTYAPLGDDCGLDLGLSQSWTPRHYYIGGVRTERKDTQRSLTGADLTFRWEPLSRNAWRKLLWGAELFRNSERRKVGVAAGAGERTDPLDGASVVFPRKTAWGGYSFVDWRFAPRWSGGGFCDFAEDLDVRAKRTAAYGFFAAFRPSEFQWLRLQLSRARDNSGGKADGQVFLQYSAAIGTHAHTFKDR